MAASVCQGLEARRRVLGSEKVGDPPFPMTCSGEKAWHNFRTLDSGDPVPFFLCEAHRTFLRTAKQARATLPT